MPLPELALALLVLLLTPGPTNTLLALAGAEGGPRRGLALLPAEISAYLLVTVPLAHAGTELIASFPHLRSGLALAAAIWVAVLAVRLWRVPEGAVEGRSVSARRVFITTLLNPKGLIIGLVLLPSHASLGPRLALFAGLIALAAMTWCLLGSLLRGRAAFRLPLVRRAGACWLGVLSVSLAAAGLSA